MLRGANLPTPSGGRDSSREVWLSSACVLPGCEWRLLVEAGCAQASSNFRREMRWLRAPVPATRARNGRTRGKRDIRPSVSACREPRARHWRVLAETLRFLAPCVTVLRGPESYTSSDDSSPHPVPQPLSSQVQGSCPDARWPSGCSAGLWPWPSGQPSSSTPAPVVSRSEGRGFYYAPSA